MCIYILKGTLNQKENDTDGESIYFNCGMGNEFTGPRLFCSMLPNTEIILHICYKVSYTLVKTTIKAKIRNKSKVKKRKLHKYYDDKAYALQYSNQACKGKQSHSLQLEAT